jgi:arsenate reductase-like glutaredoxin family protein
MNGALETGRKAMKKIDWMYDRRACTTCKKAQGFLASVGGKVTESHEASKIRYNPEAALALVQKADKLIAIRGKKVVTFDLKKDPPDEATLLAHLIGPTGNLRAPTAFVGKTLVVGFNEEAYKEILGV